MILSVWHFGVGGPGFVCAVCGADGRVEGLIGSSLFLSPRMVTCGSV